MGAKRLSRLDWLVGTLWCVCLTVFGFMAVVNPHQVFADALEDESALEGSAGKVDEPWAVELEEATGEDEEGLTSAPEDTLEVPSVDESNSRGLYLFSVPYLVDYDLSYQMLTLTNTDRGNEHVSSLLWDQRLHEYALERAVELAVSYGDTRPNGTADSPSTLMTYQGIGTVSLAVGKRFGNIEAGSATSGNKLYQALGSELSSSYTRFGSAVVKIGGRWFGYACYCNGSSTNTSHPTGTASSTKSLSVTTDMIELQLAPTTEPIRPISSCTVGLGSIQEMTLCLGQAPIDASSLTWSSANTSIARVSVQSTSSPKTVAIDGRRVGTTTIKGIHGSTSGKTCELTVTVKDMGFACSSSSISVAQGHQSTTFKLTRDAEEIDHVVSFKVSDSKGFSVNYSVDDPSRFSVSGGKTGSYTLRITDETDAAQLTFPVNVLEPFTCSVSSITISVGETTPHLYFRRSGSHIDGITSHTTGTLNYSLAWGTESFDPYPLYFTITGSRACSTTLIFTDTVTSQVLTIPLTVTATSSQRPITWTRLAGNTRYDTMETIVNAGWNGSTEGTVIVARGDDFKDALTAAGAAGLDGAPIVLTSPTSLSRQAKRTLEALSPQAIYVVGGTAAVQQGVLDQMRSATGVKPQRIYGANSAATSAKIAMTFQGSWSSNTAILATNKTFKDALSMAPVSYAKHWPILLVTNGTKLDATVVSALKDLKIQNVYIAGGTAAVSEGVEKQIKGMDITVKSRFAGKNAVGTSRLIADWALKSGLAADNMGYANSQNKYKGADALAGAALCGKNGSVLLLCDDKASANVQFSLDNRKTISQGYIFGGTAVFSNELKNRLPKTQ